MSAGLRVERGIGVLVDADLVVPKFLRQNARLDDARQVQAPRIPIVVRNNSTDTRTGISVGAEARDVGGSLIGASAISTFASVVEPGALAIGTTSFDQPLPEGSVVTFYPNGDDNPEFYEDQSGVVLTEFVVSPERIIGTVRNPADVEIEDVYLLIACFDQSGTLVTTEVGRTVRGDPGPGESSAFDAITLTNVMPPCDSFLATGQGY